MTSAWTTTRRRTRGAMSIALAFGVVGVAGTATATAAAKTKPASTTKHWSGTGNRSLGTVKLTTDSVVRWTSSGKSFSLTDRSKKLKISGRAASGQSFAVRRTYRGVRVTAKGRWTLSIAPLPAPKK
jgi:hypothetical protein